MAGTSPVCGCGGDPEPPRQRKVLGMPTFVSGFRFQPSDEVLIRSYLIPKLANQLLPFNVIRDVKLYDYNPEELVANHRVWGEDRWYFFTPRDRKYPNGSRPNRAAGNGYWKSTGSDKEILYEGKQIGVKRSLVFYTEKSAKGGGGNHDWVMNEYVVANNGAMPHKPDGTMKLDDWVLCYVQKVRVTKRRRRPEAPRQTSCQYPARPRSSGNQSKNNRRRISSADSSYDVGSEQHAKFSAENAALLGFQNEDYGIETLPPLVEADGSLETPLCGVDHLRDASLGDLLSANYSWWGDLDDLMNDIISDSASPNLLVSAASHDNESQESNPSRKPQ